MGCNPHERPIPPLRRGTQTAAPLQPTPPSDDRFAAVPHPLDTVAVAASDPDREQPWGELGLKADEYDRIRQILGRRPTSSELAMYSVM